MSQSRPRCGGLSHLAAADFQDYKEFVRPRQFEFKVYGRDAGTIARDPSGTYTVDPDAAAAAP